MTDRARQMERRDVRRNRERLLSAAREAFTESGLSAPADDIAQRADVALTTLYRHFPNRALLVAAVTEVFMDEMSQHAERALLFEDSWDGLVYIFEVYGEAAAESSGFAELVANLAGGWTPARHRYMALREELLRRNQEAGKVRADVTFVDLGFLTVSVTTIAQLTEKATPGFWRRHLVILLDGLQSQAQVLPAVDPDRPMEEAFGVTEEESAETEATAS